MSNVVTRTLSGAIFVGVVVGAILAGALYAALLINVVIVWSMLEFYNIVIKERVRAEKISGVLSGIIIFWGGFFCAQGNIAYSRTLFLLIIPMIVLIFISQLYSPEKNKLRAIAYTITGIVYIAVPLTMLTSLMFIRPSGEYTPVLLLGFFLLLWANDTFAYIFGVSFGRHRLFESISPKKSWEGFFGGLAFTLALSILLAKLMPVIQFLHWIAVAGIIVVFGVFGDLVESLFKRNMKIKDSGNFIPGHGGILDRFDSVFIAAPMVYFYLKMIVFRP